MQLYTDGRIPVAHFNLEPWGNSAMRIAFAALIGATIVLCETLPAATIIHAGRLIDGRSDELQTEMSIVVEDGKITEVVKGFINPADGDRLIETDHA